MLAHFPPPHPISIRQAARRLSDLRKRLGAAASHRMPRGLKWRLTSAAIAVALAVLILTYATLSWTSSGVAVAEAERRATDVASCFADVVSEAVAARDRMQVKLLASAFLRHGVCAVTVFDAANKPLFVSDGEATVAGPSPNSARVCSPHTGPRGEDDYLYAAREVRFGDAVVGSVHLFLDRSDLEASLRSATFPVYVIVGLGFLALTALGLVWLHSPFIALRKLACAARRIGDGDLSARVPVQGADEVAELCVVFNSMIDGLVQARQESLAKQLETIHAMINSVEAKDPYTAGHCVRVSNYAKEILERHGKHEPRSAFLMQAAALLHDLGKLGIPDRILLKTEKLSPEEIQVIQSHVTVGAEILGHMDSMKDVALWIRHHHERWDGLGYPNGLRGDAIPFPSRVIAVADALDAMMTHRPYRKALSREAAEEALRRGKGTQFDPQVVDLAVAYLEQERNERDEASDLDSDRVHESSLQLA